MTATLLIEIGVEELPPAAMQPLADAFASGIDRYLADAGLDHGAVSGYATPRRLAAVIAETASETTRREVEKLGPTVAIAFDDADKPTPAAEGFARSVGVAVSELDRQSSEKGERLVYRGYDSSRALDAVVQSALDVVLPDLPVPKRMRWGDTDHVFVRPVHWLVALHGRTILPVRVFDIGADRTTHGHRFHQPEPMELEHADEYADRLATEGHVLPDPAVRRERIVDQTHAAARKLGGHALIDPRLLNEVVALVEWPVAVAGTFDERFLVLPREVLVSTLEGHQRYFPVADDNDHLIAGFIAIANIESTDVAQVIAGNERVIRPRLADALFFWTQDIRHGLEAHVAGLDRVSFQQQLGSLADKTARVRAIARILAERLGAADPAVDRAALLAKADLLTEMVGEFPDLQGIMGEYYAREANEADVVARALSEQYAPAQSGAPIAETRAGRILAIADRADTLAGIFSTGQRPSGDKDPFALRRSALGLLRTIIEGGLDIDLDWLLTQAIRQQPLVDEKAADDLWMFHVERLRGYYLDQGISSDQFEAARAAGIADLNEFHRRLKAVTQFIELPQASLVCGAHKRIRNILKGSDGAADKTLNTDILVEPAEKTLARALDDQQTTYREKLEDENFTGALEDLASLAGPLDQFFEDVMVMSDDTALRDNRLALLQRLDAHCRMVADLSCLALG